MSYKTRKAKQMKENAKVVQDVAEKFERGPKEQATKKSELSKRCRKALKIAKKRGYCILTVNMEPPEDRTVIQDMKVLTQYVNQVTDPKNDCDLIFLGNEDNRGDCQVKPILKADQVEHGIYVLLNLTTAANGKNKKNHIQI